MRPHTQITIRYNLLSRQNKVILFLHDTPGHKVQQPNPPYQFDLTSKNPNILFMCSVFCCSLTPDSPGPINQASSQLRMLRVSWLIILDLSPNILLQNVLSTQTSCLARICSLLERVMYTQHFMSRVLGTKPFTTYSKGAF